MQNHDHKNITSLQKKRLGVQHIGSGQSDRLNKEYANYADCAAVAKFQKKKYATTNTRNATVQHIGGGQSDKLNVGYAKYENVQQMLNLQDYQHMQNVHQQNFEQNMQKRTQ